jgi:hypothetical protein
LHTLHADADHWINDTDKQDPLALPLFTTEDSRSPVKIRIVLLSTKAWRRIISLLEQQRSGFLFFKCDMVTTYGKACASRFQRSDLQNISD